MGDDTTEEAGGGPLHQVEGRVSFVEEQLERDSVTSSESLEHRRSVAAKAQKEIQAKYDGKGFKTKYWGWRSIVWVACLGDIQRLSKLLKDPGAKVNSTDDEGNTALHHAVLSACQYDYAFNHFYQCIDLLMRNTRVKLNMPNTKGYTAIGLAVHHLHKTCVERMLKHPSSDRLYLDYYLGDSEYTARETVMQTYPELQSVLPKPPVESLEAPERNIKLLAALQLKERKIFRENLDLTNPNPWYDEPYYSTLLEIACQMKDCREFVKRLLESGANPNITNRFTDMPLLHATARSGNLDTLEILLKKIKIDASLIDNEERTILHWWACIRERKPDDKVRLENCFKLLLGNHSFMDRGIDFQDTSGNTALYNAVKGGFRDRAVLLLSEGADIILFEQVSPILSEANKSLLEGILDDCVESDDEKVTSINCKLRYKDKLLEKILPSIAESPYLRGLLKHPVVATFLNLKWQQINILYILNVIFYVAFLFILTAHILLSETSNTLSNECVANITNARVSFNDSSKMRTLYRSVYRTTEKYTMGDSSPQWLWVCLMISLAGLTIKVAFQLVIYGKTYIMSLESWLEILLIVAIFVSCSRLFEGMQVKLHFCVVAIVLGWVELVLMSGRTPLLSVQLEMLKTVSLTFLRYMKGYVLLLVAFALGFYILFKGSVDQCCTDLFGNVLHSLIKTIVMFAGEFEASDLCFDILKGTSHVIFLLFVVLMAIILLNLLNGLAVGDTEKIRVNAETLSLVARVRLIAKIETVLYALPRFMVPKKLRRVSIVFYPNRPNSIEPTVIRSLLRIITNRRRDSKKSKSKVSHEKWSLLTEKLSSLEKQLHLKTEEMHKILKKILAHLEKENGGQI
jgi:ankyrin repeat protein